MFNKIQNYTYYRNKNSKNANEAIQDVVFKSGRRL